MTLPDPLGLIGVKLGPYIVRESLTEGGVAVLYRGEHESLQSAVAVKVLIPDAVSEDIRPTLEQMFLREAQILSQLRSEDILRALDHGRVVCPADGVERPYIVVDYLEGRPLSDDLEQRAAEIPKRPYSLEEAVTVLEPIARALSVCHESGIVHRDVNPRNVFLEDDGPGKPPRAKLIDFGFAKEVYRTEALRLESVSGTLFARSPDYAAPEHYDREQFGELSETTDTYTLALMLVEMLTLERPLRGITDTDLWLATKDENDRPTPNNRGARVSPRVEALFAEALAVDQLKRPQVLSEWWARLAAATRPDLLGRGAPGAAGGGADSLGSGGAGRGVPQFLDEEDDAGDGMLRLEEPTARRRLERGDPEKPSGRLGVFVVIFLLLAAIAGGIAWWRVRPLPCPPGYADCNGQHADGCETALQSDPTSCGACGVTCAHSDGVACVLGQCRITTCPAGFKDCNASPRDGCELDVRTDSANCGDCAHVCGAEGTKSAACVASKCELACKPGLVDCDGDTATGCETNVWKDQKNCGRCGVVCAGGCVEGLCAPAVLVSGIAATHLAAQGGTVYYWDATAHRIERVSADEKPTVVADNVTDLSGLTALGDRLLWATPAGVFSRRVADSGGATERVTGPLAGATPLVASRKGSYVAWAQRAAPAAARREAKHPGVPGDRRRVVAAAIADRGKPAQSVAECNEWPRTFAADDRDVYCCDATTPLASVVCDGGKCTHRDLGVSCPDELAMDADHVYFAADLRVFSLDRKSNALTVLAKRKRHPKNVATAGAVVYWTEGTDVYRLALDATPATAPELIARRQTDVTALVADDAGVYWVAGAEGAGGKEAAGEAIYGVLVAERR